MEELAPLLDIISKEHIIDKINKIVMADKPFIGFLLLFKTGLLKQFLPEMVELHGLKEVQ